ncbi:alpha/beta fold hydrolase [Roseomonas chloroacetimidivorans]|uniref:alpha/beta fold hydrolase n=1 Tax=Roseomonas chloroacetimidivorans TaxID=1766656 RepID=UPI003C74BA60
MNLLRRSHGAQVRGRTLAGVLGALGVLALVNHLVARRSERRHPPEGSFIEVDGVRLHYSDRGIGSPVVLIHGNMVTGDDYNTSGVAELLLKTHRVIIFDRPGFGHSDRPRGRMWTAREQAELLHRALRVLGVERPVVVGHSWGAIVALAFAERHPADTAGLVLLSGYYFWTLRPDVLLVAPGAIPIMGDILRYTVSPLFGWLVMPLLKRMLFSPARVPVKFHAEYSPAMSLRPSQIRATSMDGALMIPGALGLRRGYKDLSMPVVIIAGDGDKVVFKRSAERLHAEIKGSDLQIVSGAGHMVHHLAARQVAGAIDAVATASQEGVGLDSRTR